MTIETFLEKEIGIDAALFNDALKRTIFKMIPYFCLNSFNFCIKKKKSKKKKGNRKCPKW